MDLNQIEHSTQTNNSGNLTETQPLLSHHDFHSSRHKFEFFNWTQVSQELFIIAKLTVPLTVAMIMLAGFNTVTNSYLGNIGTQELASAALAFSFYTVTTMTPLVGMMTAVDTLISQAHANPNAMKALPSIYFQRAMIVCTLAATPTLLLHFNYESIMLSIGQNPDIARLGGQFARYMNLFTLPVILYHNLKSFFTAQGFVWPFLATCCVIGPLQYVLLALVSAYGWIENPMIIVPIVCSITMTISCMVLAAFGYFAGAFEHWPGLHPHSLKNWQEFIRLGSSGLILLTLETICLESFTLLASYYDETVLAAQNVIATSLYTAAMLSTGLQLASTIRIGQCLGSNQPQLAKQSTILNVMLSVFIGIATWTIVYTYAFSITELFSNDIKIIQFCEWVLKSTSIIVLIKSVNSITIGVLIGQGRPHISAIWQLISGYLVSIPVALILVYVFEMGILGLWVGIGSGYLVQCSGQLYHIIHTDWNLMAKRAEGRGKSIQAH